jgi:hypothetical protein
LAAAGGGAAPIGLICAKAGPAATPAIAATHSKELERRLTGRINVFISNDNPASRIIITSLVRRPPVGSTTRPLS